MLFPQGSSFVSRNLTDMIVKVTDSNVVLSALFFIRKITCEAFLDKLNSFFFGMSINFVVFDFIMNILLLKKLGVCKDRLKEELK